MKTIEKEQAVAPFRITIIDLMDSYPYADVFDDIKYSWLNRYAQHSNFEAAVETSDRLFWALNKGIKNQKQWCELDDGYDVRVYDKNWACVYAAHKKLPENEAEKDKQGKLKNAVVEALKEAKKENK